MWTIKNRARYERKGLRYESDLTDEEYALIEPFLPPERNVSRRSICNGILYVLTTGCQWRQLPKDFLPESTTHDYFVELQCTGVLTRIHHALHSEVRVLEVRSETPTRMPTRAMRPSSDVRVKLVAVAMGPLQLLIDHLHLSQIDIVG